LNQTNNKNFDYAPIFIVGCGHSGTSLLLAILGEHPSIFAVPGESNIALQNDSDFFLKEIEKFNALTITAGKKRWAEKTPSHIRHIGKILNWEPKSKLILIVRDGRDVAYSIKQRTGDLKGGIQRWVSDNVAGKQYWEHPQVYIIRYEDIISNFEHSLTELLKFLGEDYSSSMKSFHTTPKRWYSDEIIRPENAFGGNHRRYRNWQINQPLFDGRGKWKLLSSEEISVIKEEAGSLLLEFGYV
jgi:hypothetical protein